MNEITVLMIGDSGAGKSSFGNYYLEDNVFETDDNFPFNREAVAKSRTIEGCTRWVIDTGGFYDGQLIKAVQIQNLAKLMRNYKRGINAIAIILNGQHDKFSRNVKDVIKFVYNAFGTKETVSHICIVFTKCYTTTNPKREKIQTKYMNSVKKFLSEISGMPLDQVPEVPVFFVDCYPEGENRDSEANKILFHGWVMCKDPLDLNKFK